MKSAEVFWNVIGQYNESTWVLQLFLFILLVASVIIALKWKIAWLPKICLAIINLFIAIVFFLITDKSAIGYYFSMPLYLSISVLLIIDSFKNINDPFNKFSTTTFILLILTLLYPLISFLLGHSFPKQVLYILPCPVISFSILIYSRYKNQSIIILILMTVWAITGIKALIFNAYEDLILFAMSFYGIYLITKKIKDINNKRSTINVA